MSVSWNLWHGCHKISEGCRHCYVYRQDSRYDKDSSVVTRTAAFDLPLRRKRNGDFRVPFTYFMTTMPQIPRNRHTHTPYFFAKAVSVIQKITTNIPRHSPAFYAKIAKGERRGK